MSEQNNIGDQNIYQSPEVSNFSGTDVEPTSGSLAVFLVAVLTVFTAYWVTNVKPCKCYGNIA
ncbi:hypothetical protein [Enterococcus sp.]|uniref:hypothetical protein n=1 Tax=Enterococcus sp. TaxID=35783 RepID=UPI00290E3D5E|nr:hypothetical protein [Enterococcus sp.]MDU5337310.1 hypothetical protein [Enterococcus sp.]